MCFSSWKMALKLHRTAISSFIWVFNSVQSPVSLIYLSSHYISLLPNKQAVLGLWKKVNFGKAFIAPSERLPLPTFSF